MNVNMGGMDRTLRFITALILFLVGYNFVNALVYSFVIYFFAVILLITSFLGNCPLYTLFRFSSKGTGLDKITKRDIERAVKDFSLEESQGLDSVLRTKKSPVKKKKAVVKKKTVQKGVSKKKIVKKFPVKKKAVSKKKVVAKKKIVKKKTAKDKTKK